MNTELLWNNFLNKISEQFSPLSYDTWFKDTKLHKIDNGTAIVIVPTILHKKHLEENYLDDDGKMQTRYMCDFGINLDERIADGFYFAKSFQLFKEYLQFSIFVFEQSPFIVITSFSQISQVFVVNLLHVPIGE